MTNGGAAEQQPSHCHPLARPSASPLSRHGLFFWGTWLSLLTAFALANAASSLTEAERFGMPLEAWKPYLWEATSAVGVLVALPALAWFVERFPLSRRRLGRQLLLHLAAALTFSALHITVMLTLREAAYAVTGHSYSFGPWVPGLIYELRKDLVAYLLIVVLLTLMKSTTSANQTKSRTAAQNPERSDAARPRPLLLPDGARSVSVDPTSLLAVKAAGNYVELLRRNESSLLIRATLTEVEAATQDFDFLRVHRSWIVARDCIRQVTSTRAGDFKVRLDGGLVVPGSRRYRGCLKQPGERSTTASDLDAAAR